MTLNIAIFLKNDHVANVWIQECWWEDKFNVQNRRYLFHQKNYNPADKVHPTWSNNRGINFGKSKNAYTYY